MDSIADGNIVAKNYSQEVLVLGLLESEIFKGDIRPNLCVCLFVCVCVCVCVYVRFLTRVKNGKNC